MTLEQWLREWPYVGRHVFYDDKTGKRTLGEHTATPTGRHTFVVPDGVEPIRAEAWHLSDYQVSSVQGGSIWFIPRQR